MKKIIFTLLILTGLTVGTKAQEEAKLWIGGTFNVSTYKVKDVDGSAKNFTIAPEVGVNLSDKWGLGLAIGYSHVDSHSSDYKANEFFINPFARFTYFRRDLASLFIDGGIEYGTSHRLGNEKSGNELEIGFKPGVAFNVAPNVKLLAKVGFLGYNHTKAANSTKTDSFGLNLDLSQIQLGVNFLF